MLEIEYISISEIKPNPKNARKHSEEQINQLIASINEFGYTNPILIDEANNIIAGHGRYEAMKRSFKDDIACIRIIGLTESQKKAYLLADNKLAMNSTWDIQALDDLINDLDKDGFDLTIAGFADEDIRKLTEEIEKQTQEQKAYYADADELPEEKEQVVTKKGDLWILGRHKLLCGDSTKGEEIEKVIGNKKIDLWITDPPYNVAYNGKTDKKMSIDNDSMGDDEFLDFLSRHFLEVKSRMGAGRSFYIFHAAVTSLTFPQVMKECGLTQRQMLVWRKNTLVIGRSDYQWIHEPIIYGWETSADHRWFSDRKQTTVLDFDNPRRNDQHPTAKPIAILEYLINNSSQIGELLFDGFGGSGSLIIAAEKTGRVCASIELDEMYCDRIVRRWQNFSGQAAVNQETGKTFNEHEKNLD